jgi:hypothetical protein
MSKLRKFQVPFHLLQTSPATDFQMSFYVLGKHLIRVGNYSWQTEAAELIKECGGVGPYIFSYFLFMKQ